MAPGWEVLSYPFDSCRYLPYPADSKKSAQRRLYWKTRAGVFPVLFFTRLASAAFAKFVAASSVLIPSRFATRSIKAISFSLKAVDSGPFSVT